MWEIIPEEKELQENDGQVSARLRVPGGWVVRTHLSGMNSSAVAQTFVADSSHSWELTD